MNTMLSSNVLKKPQPGCGCPACADLACLERPRFFAGQLLTEAELNSEQAWVIAKNKLHNRYLHGPGVVCGLQVVCGDCDGHVTVRSGYAIDPCGNDIVVCADQDFDLVQAIADCCAASRSRRSDCDPYAPVWNSTACRDVEETWCVSIRYLEKEARPTTALPTRGSGSAYKCAGTGCACQGCGGSAGSGKCGGRCGCNPASTTPPTGSRPAACQPTRIVESYRIGIVAEPDDPAAGDKADDGTFGKLLRLAPPGTLLRRLIDCASGAYAVLQKHMTAAEMAMVLGAAEGKYVGTPAAQYAALCHLRQAIVALYAADGCNVRCDAARVLSSIVCPSPGPNSTTADYGAQIAPAVRQLALLGLQYLIDCWCCAFLPSCDGGVADDRLLLACVTVKDGKVLRICNLGPRQFAGAFPSMLYWLSIVPLLPLLRRLLESLCCHPLGLPSRLQQGAHDAALRPFAAAATAAPAPAAAAALPGASGFRDTALPDPDLWSLLAANDFAVPRDLFKRAESLLKFIPADGSLAEIASRNSVDVRPLLGAAPDAAAAALAAGGVVVDVHSVEGKEADAHRGVALASPLALRGDKLVVFRSGDRVVGFGPPGDDGLAAMRTELAALRREVAQLRKR